MAKITQTTIGKFCETHKVEIAAISRALATDFETPAQSAINAGFARMGVQRFQGKDDVWEMVACHLNNWAYEPPPQRLMRRWATY